MNTVTAFVLGLIVGWVIEWIIDWVYWRGRRTESARRPETTGAVLAQQADLRRAAGARADLESQLTALKADNSTYQQKLAVLEAEKASWQAQAASLQEAGGVRASLENQLEALKADNAACREQVAALEAEKASGLAGGVSASAGLPVPPIPAGLPIPPVAGVAPIPVPVPLPSIPSVSAPAPAAPATQNEPEKREEQKKQETPDDLIIIKGIGPVINTKLNQAGITTFRQLANLTAPQLRAIVGDVIQRLADEDDIINQARELADQKDQSAKL